jgi:hypothetical protein
MLMPSIEVKTKCAACHRLIRILLRDRNLTSADELTQSTNGVALYRAVDAFHVVGAAFSHAVSTAHVDVARRRRRLRGISGVPP